MREPVRGTGTLGGRSITMNQLDYVKMKQDNRIGEAYGAATGTENGVEPVQGALDVRLVQGQNTQQENWEEGSLGGEEGT